MPSKNGLLVTYEENTPDIFIGEYRDSYKVLFLLHPSIEKLIRYSELNVKKGQKCCRIIFLIYFFSLIQIVISTHSKNIVWIRWNKMRFLINKAIYLVK